MYIKLKCSVYNGVGEDDGGHNVKMIIVMRLDKNLNVYIFKQHIGKLLFFLSIPLDAIVLAVVYIYLAKKEPR